MTPTPAEPTMEAPREARWGAVYALTLCVSVLIASEFMPVSLLTPIASTLHLTEGQAGQAISVSGIFAVLTSLFIASATRGLDRRVLLLALTLVMLVSGVVTATAPSFTVLMVGRALIGVVIGGFWSMSAATAMRLVPGEDVPRALAVFNGGNALATTIAAPLGSFLGQYVGWRGAFFCVVPLGAITFLWQFATLPKMPSGTPARLWAPVALLRRSGVRHGFAAVTLFFLGQFALFTYLRPFLETATRVHGGVLSLMLLALGVSGLVGTWAIGLTIKNRLQAMLVVLPLGMAAIALGLVAFGTSPVAVAILISLWGLVGTAAPVAWWAWLARTVPDEAEVGGGLMVAVVQLAITAGAAGGGLLFDVGGYRPTFAASAGVFCLSAAIAFAGTRAAAPRRCPHEEPAHAPA